MCAPCKDAIFTTDSQQVIFTTDVILLKLHHPMKLNAGNVKSRSNVVIAASCCCHVVLAHLNCGRWRLAYLSFYGVHSAVVVILDYASTMRPNQNSSCSSALALSVSLDISSLIHTEVKTFVMNTYVRHNKLSVSSIGVDCSQVRLLKLLKKELE